jgi:hypothetical protein
MQFSGLTLAEYEAIAAVEGQYLSDTARARLIAVQEGRLTAEEARQQCLNEIRSRPDA